MIKGIATFIAALNGNLKRGQIASGFAWGVLFGLIPAGNFFWVFFFIVSFCFRHHQGSKILVMALVKLLSLALLPLTDALGWQLLHLESLVPFYTVLYNMPFVPFTRFNNTLVAGGIAAGIGLWLPMYFLVRGLIPRYREILAPKIRDSRVVKAFYKAPLINSIAGAVHTIQEKAALFSN
ncbi:MAG: TIGR03546 family protein [Treponema sp.]|nr:TIGR03546 family protein [Treponema sp.]